MTKKKGSHPVGMHEKTTLSPTTLIELELTASREGNTRKELTLLDRAK
jgi:hypothetical protein